jgi:hypothetical protein
MPNSGNASLEINGTKFPYEIIDESQRDRYFETGFNKPGKEVDDKVFDAEFQAARVAIDKSLQKSWKSGIEDDDDFFISGDYFEKERSIGVEVSREEFLTPDMLATVLAALKALPVAYSAHITNDIVFLRLPGGEPYPDFSIIVQPTKILIYSESPKVLKMLGITSK